MFDISEKLITEQSDEIYEISTINWEHSSWKYLSLVGDEEVISLLHTKVYVLSDSVLSLGKMNENPQSNTVWEDKLMWFKSSPQYRAVEYFPGFTTLQLCSKFQEFLSKLSEKPEKSLDGLSSCRWSTTSHGDLKTKNNKKMRIKCLTRFSLSEEIWSRTMVILRTWIRKEVALYK